MTWVQPVGNRPGGWTDGDPWRDPSPVGQHLRPSEVDLSLLCVLGRRTAVEPCPRCGGVIVEHEDGYRACTRPQQTGGCRWYEVQNA